LILILAAFRQRRKAIRDARLNRQLSSACLTRYAQSVRLKGARKISAVIAVMCGGNGLLRRRNLLHEINVSM
jgi:urease gamma subunit